MTNERWGKKYFIYHSRPATTTSMKTEKKLCIILAVVEINTRKKIIILCVIFRRSSIAQWPTTTRKPHPDRRKSFIMIWMSLVSSLARFAHFRARDKLTDYLYQILPRNYQPPWPKSPKEKKTQIYDSPEKCMRARNARLARTANRFKSAFLVLCCANIYQMSTDIWKYDFSAGKKRCKRIRNYVKRGPTKNVLTVRLIKPVDQPRKIHRPADIKLSNQARNVTFLRSFEPRRPGDKQREPSSRVENLHNLSSKKRKVFFSSAPNNVPVAVWAEPTMLCNPLIFFLFRF